MLLNVFINEISVIKCDTGKQTAFEPGMVDSMLHVSLLIHILIYNKISFFVLIE